jgi:surfactin synthase thioesterase subunit
MPHHLSTTTTSDTLYLVLPGISQGATSGIVKDITDKLEKAGKTWLSITYPFQDQDLNESENQTLEAEMQEVMEGIKLISQGKRYKKMVIIAKSFGALVASKLIETFRKDYANEIDLYILGYIFGDMSGPHPQIETPPLAL